MTEIILSEITRMGPGLCVIGLQPAAEGFRSIRPMPPRGFAWPNPFLYLRGDKLRFQFSAPPVVPPHVEDRPSTGVLARTGSVAETDLVKCLWQAEMAQKTRELFGCHVRESPLGGGGVWVKPEEAPRSICGCDFQNLRFRLYPARVRAGLVMVSGETLRSLPVVDRDWNEFIERAVKQIGGANRLQRVQRFLNGRILEKILSSPDRLARIGVARPDPDGACWLMLDSIFPLPQAGWLEDLG